MLHLLAPWLPLALLDSPVLAGFRVPLLPASSSPRPLQLPFTRTLQGPGQQMWQSHHLPLHSNSLALPDARGHLSRPAVHQAVLAERTLGLSFPTCSVRAGRGLSLCALGAQGHTGEGQWLEASVLPLAATMALPLACK